MPLAASNSNSNGVKSHQLQCVNNGQQQSQQTQQQQQQYTEYTTTNIPAFLSKLWTLVEDTKYDQLIAWDPSGFSFHVYDQTRFAKEILPRFFKHNNMASFIRQLNMYGFRKVNSIDHGSLKNEKEDLEFHHPYFIRGKEQFLEFIKRKVPDIKANPASTAVAAAPSSVNGQPAGGGQATPSAALVAAVAPSSAQPIVQFPGIKQDDLNKVLDDVNSLKSKQKYVDSSLMDVKKENEVLWKEIATLRQKHHHQQQIVNKLIHFLVHLVNPSSLGIKRTRPLMIDSHSANRLANVDVLNGELSDSEDACGGEINEIDDDDEEEFLSNTSSSHHHLDQPPSKKAKVNHSSIYVMPPSNPSSSVVHGSMVNGGSASGGLVNDHKTTKFGPITQNFSPPNGSSSSTSSSSSSAIITNGGGNGNGITSHHHQAYTTANQPGGVVINEIIDSPTSLLGFESANKDAKGLTTTNGDFIDTNLFLNANPPNQHQQQSDPIITTPSSPLDDAANLKNGQRANSLTTSASMPVQPTSTMVQTLNEAPPPITLNSIPDGGSEDLSGSQEALIRRSMSNQQMSDHVEALQLDLASIKEFLSSNSFNQIDPYTISNLFSPLGLDSSENDSFYLEPTPLSLPTALSSVDKLKQIGPALESIIPSVLEAGGPLDSGVGVGVGADLTNGGRLINGSTGSSELIQYDPAKVVVVANEQGTTSVDTDADIKWTLPAGGVVVDQPPASASQVASTSLMLDGDVGTLLATPLINTNDQEQEHGISK